MALEGSGEAPAGDRSTTAEEASESGGSSAAGTATGTELVSLVAHALKGPLQTILGTADLLLEGSFGRLGPEQRGPVSRLLRQSEELNRRTETITGLVHLLAPGTSVAPDEAVGPRSLVDAALRSMSDEARDHGATLDGEVPEDHPALRGDGTRLLGLFGIVVRSLLPRGGSEGRALRVRAWPPEGGRGRFAVLTAAEDAAGEEAPAWPGSGDSAGPGGGETAAVHPVPRDLELAVARLTVEAYGGELRVERWGEDDQYCGVFFTLPLREAADG